MDFRSNGLENEPITEEILPEELEDITNCAQWDEEEKEFQRSKFKSKKAEISSFQIQNMQRAVDQLKEEFKGKWEYLKKNEEWEMGIDEAGRGPALGPMVYSALVWPSRFRSKFEVFGFKDSKKTTENERMHIYKMAQQLQGVILDFKTMFVPAQVISNAMLAPQKISLNLLAQRAVKQLISYFIEGDFNLKQVKVDALGDSRKYQKLLAEFFSEKKPGLTFIVEEKADAKHPVVSATSICAKFERDEAVENWEFEEPGFKNASRNYGCGYPSDPLLKHWIRENCHKVFSFPSFVRHSWGTSKAIVEQRVKEKKSVQVTFPADLLTDKPEGYMDISKMMKKTKGKKGPQGYFTEDIALVENIEEIF